MHIYREITGVYVYIYRGIYMYIYIYIYRYVSGHIYIYIARLDRRIDASQDKNGKRKVKYSIR